MLQTYSRKSTKRRQSQSQPQSHEIIIARKRKKTTVEVTQQQPNSSIIPDTDTDVDDDNNDPDPNPIPNPSPFTPKKPAKDLSSLFDFSASPSPIRDADGNGNSKVGGSGIAKRMLSRSRTESSFESRSTGTDPSLGSQSKSQSFTFSSPTALKDNSPARSPSPFKQPLPAPPPIASTSTSAHTRTYAGKSRSFLISLPASSLQSVPNENGPLEEDDLEARTESYTDLRTRWGVDNSEDDPYPQPYNPPSPTPSPSHSRSHSPTKPKVSKGKSKSKDLHPPNAPSNPLKSITELRSKGETRRFLDDLGYLFEGMSSSPTGGASSSSSPSSTIGVRRATALEIVTKLCDHDFARKAKAADFYTRAWDVFVDAGAAPSSVFPNSQVDKVLAIILAFFTALVARDPASLSELAQRPTSASSDAHPDTIVHADFVQTLITLLSTIADREKDGLALVTSIASDAELKRAGIGRTEKALLTTLKNTISNKSGIFLPNTLISTRLLLTYTLSALPPSQLTSHSAHYTTTIQTLTSSLRAELRLVPPRVTAYAAGLSLFPPSSIAPRSKSPSKFALPASAPAASDMPSFEHIENCLRLLDSFLLGQWVPANGDADDGDGDERLNRSKILDGDREDGLAHELVALCIITELIVQSPQDKDVDGDSQQFIATKCTEIAFRVLLSLTQDNQAWCEALLHDELTLPFLMRTIMAAHRQWISSLSLSKKRSRADEELEVGVEIEDEADARVLDRLCLALGLLTNLVQVLDTANDLIRKTRVNPVCAGKRACIQACQCQQRVSALDCLAQIYIQQSKDNNANSDPGADFLRGHLAVLLGLFMRGNKANQRVLLAAALPGYSNRTKLAALAKQAREFVTFYAELALRLSKAAKGKNDNSDDDDDSDNATPRSDDYNVDRIARDGNNGQVAQQVISFLEKLSAQQL